MRQKISTYVLDLLTPGEHRENMEHAFSTHLRELYRGIDYPSFAGIGNGTGTLQISGPESGYAWELRLLSVQLSAVSPISLYPGESITVAPIGTATSQVNGTNNEAVIPWASKAVIIKDPRVLTIYAGAATILNYRITAKVVPAEMIGKL